MTLEQGLIALTVAGLALLGVLYGHILTRVHSLEDDLAEANTYNRRLWIYTRGLLDMYYRHRRPEAPDPHPLPEERPR